MSKKVLILSTSPRKNSNSDPRSVGEIHAGDLMLFGDSCVVLFYESFTT